MSTIKNQTTLITAILLLTLFSVSYVIADSWTAPKTLDTDSMHWEDLNGNVITSANYDDTVRMVWDGTGVILGSAFGMNIFEKDGDGYDGFIGSPYPTVNPGKYFVYWKFISNFNSLKDDYSIELKVSDLFDKGYASSASNDDKEVFDFYFKTTYDTTASTWAGFPNDKGYVAYTSEYLGESDELTVDCSQTQSTFCVQSNLFKKDSCERNILIEQCSNGCTAGACAIDNDNDGSYNDVDCNDNDATVHPGAVEICADEIDNNCNGQVDENCGAGTVCVDKDGDGKGLNCGGEIDCDDNNANIWRILNGYVDSDADKFGIGALNTQICSGSKLPTGFTTNDGDCNDNNAGIHPGVVEVCGDNIDNNCNGQVDEGCGIPGVCTDNDGDGYGAGCVLGNDCNDNDAGIHPGAVEICGNSIDENCNGNADDVCVVPGVCTDNDGDGYGAGCVLGNDCNDNDASIHPGAVEICGNSIDENCNGNADDVCGIPGDITPPASVTGLKLIGKSTSSLKWEWKNPTDVDFAGTIIKIDGINIINLTNTQNTYQLTGLTKGSTHTIIVYTFDLTGNVNNLGATDTQTTSTSKNGGDDDDDDGSERRNDDEEEYIQLRNNDVAPLANFTIIPLNNNINETNKEFNGFWALLLLLLLLLLIILIIIFLIFRKH